MTESVAALNVVAFLVSGAWAARALSEIGSRRFRSACFLLVIFFIFYGVPPFLDVIGGIPTYYANPGFQAPANSERTMALYDVFVIVCPFFWWYTSRRSKAMDASSVSLSPGWKARAVAWILTAAPLIAVPFAPNPGIYLRYGTVLVSQLSDAAVTYHGVIAALTIISVVSCTSLLLVSRNFPRMLLFVSPFLLVDIWVQGKRSIVALSILVVWIVAWIRGYLDRSRVIVFGSMTLLGFIAYISWYQGTYRPYAIADNFSVYENSRIDYGRDHNLKAALYCELDEDAPILEYRGQTFLFYLTMYVPRSVWPEKPWPYAVYFTAHALQLPPTDLGWGLTTSFLDESVANLGLIGLAVGPIFFTFLCRICDRSSDPITKLAGMLITCLFLTVEFVAFCPLAIAWVAYLGYSRLNEKRARRRARRVRSFLPTGQVQAVIAESR